MAPKKRVPRQRDYKAEYQRRVARERARATAEGRAYSSHRARGHRSAPYESEQRRRLKVAKLRPSRDLVEAARLGIEPVYWQLVLDHTEQLMGFNWLNKRLQGKVDAYQAHESGDDEPGRDAWREFTGRFGFLSKELYYYK